VTHVLSLFYDRFTNGSAQLMNNVVPVTQIPPSLRWLSFDVVGSTGIIIGALTMSTLGYIDGPYLLILAGFTRTDMLTGLQFIDWVGLSWGTAVGLAATRWSRSWSWLWTFVSLLLLCAMTLAPAVCLFDPLVAAMAFSVPLPVKCVPAWVAMRLARLLVWNLERANGDGEAQARASLWAAGTAVFCLIVRPPYVPTVLLAVVCAAVAALLAAHWLILKTRKRKFKPAGDISPIVAYPTKEDALHGTHATLCYNFRQTAALLDMSKKAVSQLVANGTLSLMTHPGKKPLFGADAVLEVVRSRGTGGGKEGREKVP
jgi:hypothetical protein